MQDISFFNVNEKKKKTTKVRGLVFEPPSLARDECSLRLGKPLALFYSLVKSKVTVWCFDFQAEKLTQYNSSSFFHFLSS